VEGEEREEIAFDSAGVIRSRLRGDCERRDPPLLRAVVGGILRQYVSSETFSVAHKLGVCIDGSLSRFDIDGAVSENPGCT